MALTILDATTRAAVAAATDQEAQLTALIAPWVADRTLAEGEVSLIQRILPEGVEAQSYIEELSKRPLDLDRGLPPVDRACPGQSACVLRHGIY